MLKRKYKIILFIVILLSLFIRLYPVAARLPGIYWHDEKNYIETALRFGSGEFMPYQLSHGGIFYIFLFILYGLYYLVGFLMRMFTSPLGFYLEYLKDPSIIFILSRSAIAVSGTLMLVFVYKSALILFKDFKIALISMLFASFSLLSVQLSSVAYADMFSVMLLVMAFYIGIKGMVDNKEIFIYISSFLVGLATAAKYNCVFGIFFVILMEIYRYKANNRETKFSFVVKSMFVKVFVFFIAFIIGNPFILNGFAMFYRDTIVLMGEGYLVDNPYKFPFSLWFHIKYHLRNALGLPLEILFILGLFYGFLKDKKKFILISIFPITFYFLFSNSIGFCLHLLPIVPFAAIISAKVLIDILERVKIRSLFFSLLISLIILFPTFNNSLKFIFIVPKVDTRAIGKDWIESNIQEGAVILQEGSVSRDIIMSPQIMPNLDTVQRDIAYSVSNKGSGRAFSIIRDNMDYIYVFY